VSWRLDSPNAAIGITFAARRAVADALHLAASRVVKARYGDAPGRTTMVLSLNEASAKLGNSEHRKKTRWLTCSITPYPSFPMWMATVSDAHEDPDCK